MMRLGGMRTATAAIATVVLVGATARCGAAQEKPEVAEKAPVVITRAGLAGIGGSFLGVSIADVDAGTVERLDLDAERGARVADVSEDGPAARAGIREDDVIVAWNGAPVESAAQLRRLVAETPAGREVEVAVVRDGKRLELPAEIGERPSARGVWAMRMPAPEAVERLERRIRSPEVRTRAFALFGGGRLGIGVQTLGDQLAAYFGLDGKDGVLVTSVREDSPAARGGLRAGDVILALGDEGVGTPGALVDAVREADPGPVAVRVLRDRKERSLTVELPERTEPTWEVAPSAGAMMIPEMLERIELPDLDLQGLFRFEGEPAEPPAAPPARI